MANESRKSRALRQQNPGMASTGRVDPAAGARARRAAAGEQAAGLRYRQGLRVQDDGSLEVHTDATLRVDQRQQLGVRNKFDTPTQDTQAANKAYVDAQIAQLGTAYRVQTDLAFDQLYASPTGFITVPVVAGPGTTAVTSELDLGNLLAAGSDGILLKGGHSYIIRGGLSAISGNNNYHQGRLVAAVKNVTSGVLTILLWRTVRTSDDNRTHWTVEAVYTATEDVEAVLLYEWLITGSFRLAFPLLSAQRVVPYDEDNGPLPLPPLPDGFAAISYNELTAVAWTDDLSLWGNGLPDSDTFTWTFDEWGPTYLTYSGAYGAAISHRFMDGGTHTVQLTASGPSGSDTATVDVVVQDVVETQNLLHSVGVFAFEDYSVANPSLTFSTASIASPDGTLTAEDIVNASGSTQEKRHIHTIAPWHEFTHTGYIYYSPISGDTVRVLFYLRNQSSGTITDSIQIRFDNSGDITAFTSVATSSRPYTSERDVYIERIGNTGWLRWSIHLNDHSGTADRAYLAIQVPSAVGTATVWNPTLRYGDWVSREKNWQGTPLIDWAITAGASKAYSATAAPDGTLSAVQTSLPAGGNCDISATNAIAAAVPAYASVTLEAYINHSDGDWDSGRIYHYLRSSSAFPEMVYIDIDPAGGFAASLATLATSGPGYTTAEHAEATQIGTNGWWRYRLTITDYGGTALTTWNYLRAANSAGATRGVFWGPRITVGNPADMLDYFVSGPQNLLGDGSDYSHWLTGTSPRDVPITANTAVAPNGRLEADTLTHTTGVAGWDYRAKVKPVTAGITTTYSYYFKTDASLPTSASEQVWVRYQDSGGVQIESIKVDISYSGNNAITAFVASTTGGPGYVSGDVIITPISNDWVRVEFSLTDYSSTAVEIICVHYSRDFSPSGTDYDVTLWGSEVTTITPKTPV